MTLKQLLEYIPYGRFIRLFDTNDRFILGDTQRLFMERYADEYIVSIDIEYSSNPDLVIPAVFKIVLAIELTVPSE